MTAHELFSFLLDAGVLLTTEPDGRLRYRGPQGFFTDALLAEMRTHKAALLAVIETSEASTVVMPETPLPDTASGGASYRTWVTGSIPNAQTIALTTPLPPPKCHDTPHTPVTYVGALCAVKKCSPNAAYPSGRPASLRYSRSGLCVACYGRWDKRTSTTTNRAQEDDHE
jgi:hypothetical protein